MNDLRIAYAADRDIGVWALEFIMSQHTRPLALLVPEPGKASHAEELVRLCSHLSPEHILRGKQFRATEGLEVLRRLDLDYILCVHFPYIVPDAVLAAPRVGVLNLHPAFLPYNRGWHTPSWALLDETPAGATLHFMDTGLDTGDVVHQRRLEPSPGDTAHTLYERLKRLELEVLQEAWPRLLSGSYERRAQSRSDGSAHRRQDLLSDRVQRIDLDEPIRPRDLIRRLRALTTNRIEEAAYYEVDGRRYRVQVHVHEEAQSK